MKNILILGGDGYLGWPTAIFFSSKGYNVTVVDNYFRRNACENLGLRPLYKSPNLINRCLEWKKKSGKTIKVILGDLTDPELMRSLFQKKTITSWPEESCIDNKPDTIVHFAEQPSAPYSMASYKNANFTISNNLLVTNNLMYAVKDFSPHSHIIKLGTMGEYGTPNIDIEEGWIDINHNGRKEKFLFPRQASSIYHTSKIMDTDLLWFGVRAWKLKVTDLMQGPVYGFTTKEIKNNEKLYTIFNYDEIFGTIINRFVTQAVVGYPLTVYGKGEQKRGYININDTIQCIDKSFSNPAKNGELRIFNQITQTFSVNQLAEMIYEVGRELNYDVSIKNIPNPRIENEDHYYNPKYQGLKDIGVKATLLNKDILKDFFIYVEKYKNNINRDIIFKGIKW
jgi:UDP-sulfoquinovose synthase